MKKILSLFLVVATAAAMLASCSGKNPASTTTVYTGTTINTVPPEAEETYTLKPVEILFEADRNSTVENAIKLVSFKTVNQKIVIGDKYMDEFGNVYTITCVGIGPGSKVPAKNDELFTFLEILGGDTKRVASSSFQACAYLANVSLGEGVESVGEYSFYLCKQLSVLSLPESLTEIGPMAFSETGLKEVVVPKNVTKIGKLAFANCSDLEKVTLPSRFNDEALLREIFVEYDDIEIIFAD